MKKQYLLAGIAFMMMTFSACNDETFDIGNTLTQDADKLSITSTEFEVDDSMRTVLADSVLLRSGYCYLGKLKDPERGNFVTAEFMTQFNVVESFSMQPESKIANKYNGMAAADSCQLEFYMEDPTNTVDTLAAMKIRISELGTPLEEGQKYYSNFDPVKEGYVRKGGFVKDKMFSYNDLTVKDSIRNITGYYNFINVKLNQPYTDKNGVEYNNYGTYIMQQYYRHPEYFKNSYAFIHNVCPGVYVSVVDGEGVYTQVPDMCLRLYYTIQVNADSTAMYASALAGTEEVLQTTKITTDQNVLNELAKNDSCTYLKAPAGLYTEVALPIDDILKGHENDSILTAKISFQRINSGFESGTMKTPSYLMMVPKDSIYSFFEKEKLPDNKLTYSTAITKGTNLYTFSNISTLITQLAKTKEDNVKKYGPQWLNEHPDWYKVLLVPVQAIMTAVSGTSTISGYEQSIGITGTKLVGGKNNPYDPVKLDIVYGKFN